MSRWFSVSGEMVGAVLPEPPLFFWHLWPTGSRADVAFLFFLGFVPKRKLEFREGRSLFWGKLPDYARSLEECKAAMSKRKKISARERRRRQLNEEGREEVFYHRRGTYKFDVDLAIEIATDGREPVEVDEESLRRCIRNNEIDEEFLREVKIGRPGIIVNVPYQLDDGRTITGHLLIDGNHRATRCLRDGKPFYAYVLNEEETTRTFLRAPATIPVPQLSAARS